MPHRRTFSLAALTAASAWLGGCSSNEDQAREALDQVLATCRAHEGDFATIEAYGGEADEVLPEACALEPGAVQVDKHGIEATSVIGPYTWQLAPHPETSKWIIKRVSYPDLDEARRTVSASEPDLDSIDLALTRLRAASEAVPEAAWPRRAVLDLELRRREMTRAKKDAQGGTGELGPEAEQAYKGYIAWAESKERAADVQRARLDIASYFRDYAQLFDNALGSVGARDAWLEKAIEAAALEKNKEDEEGYRKELEDRRAGRDDEIARLTKKRDEARARACAESARIEQEGDLGAEIAQLRAELSCDQEAPS